MQIKSKRTLSRNLLDCTTVTGSPTSTYGLRPQAVARSVTGHSSASHRHVCFIVILYATYVPLCRAGITALAGVRIRRQTFAYTAVTTIELAVICGGSNARLDPQRNPPSFLILQRYLYVINIRRYIRVSRNGLSPIHTLSLKLLRVIKRFSAHVVNVGLILNTC